MENDKVRSFEEEFDFQVNNQLCGLEFCINPDCHCDDEEDQTSGYLCAVCNEPLYDGALYVAIVGDPTWFIHLAVCFQKFDREAVVPTEAANA